MAERRMFSKMIIDSDIFLDMPLSTQALYFHLSMRADDEGFINNPKKIMRVVGAAQNELELLLAKRYILSFESGVIVIKHWKIHNLIRKDRAKETLYKEEKQLLATKENGVYTDALLPVGNHMTTKCPPRLEEVRGEETRAVENRGDDAPRNYAKELEIDNRESDEMTASQLIEASRKHWNSKANLTNCRLTVASFGSDTGLMATRIKDYGLDYVSQAIDKLNESWTDIAVKFRPKSFQRFILGNIDHWANLEIKESQEVTPELLAEAEGGWD